MKLRAEPKAFHMLGKCSVIELKPQSWAYLFTPNVFCFTYERLLYQVLESKLNDLRCTPCFLCH